MLNKVWVVTKGEYSDYQILGIFSTEGEAERLANIYRGDQWSRDVSVEGWVLDERANLSEIIWEIDEWPGDRAYADYRPFGLEKGEYLNRPEYRPNGSSPFYRVLVDQPSAEHALKVGLDLIAQLKAERTGIA